MDESSQTPKNGFPPIDDDNRPAMPEKNRRSKLFGVLLAGGILALLALNPFGCSFLSMLITGGTEAKMQKSEIYEPVARRLAIYCQSDQSLFPKYLSYAWLPYELANVNYGHCRVSTNHAFVEMGGGFYHFGYRLDLDEKISTAGSNVWQLYLYREGTQTDVHLMTLALASTQHVSAAELEQMASSGFEHSLKQGNDEAYGSLVMLKLRFGNTSEAAKICKVWIQHKPNSWLPHFTYAHVRCRLGEVETASAEFTQWTLAHKNFSHCVCLALFEFREGRTNQALTGVRLALNQPFIEPVGIGGNKFYLGLNGALIAYKEGDYDLALAMCDKMLSGSERDKWWMRKTFRLKAAAMFMKGDQRAALEEMKRAEGSRDEDMVFSVEGMTASDKKFRVAIEQQDVSYVKDLAHWADEMERWFSPFETDETGIHGGGLKIPTPYPKSWPTDRMNPETAE